ncbi:hypothetical protein Tco_0855874, partial [Tanacetum coccineum]
EFKYPLVDGDVKEVGDLSLESMEDEEVATVDGVFKGAFGALGDKTWNEGVIRPIDFLIIFKRIKRAFFRVGILTFMRDFKNIGEMIKRKYKFLVVRWYCDVLVCVCSSLQQQEKESEMVFLVMDFAEGNAI